MNDDLNLDDMKPWSVITTMLPHEYEAEFKRLKCENERLKQLVEEQRQQINALLDYKASYRSEAG
jgi:hypothetical protein